MLSALRSEIVEGCEGGARHAGFASCVVLTPRAQDLFDMVAPELASSGVSVRAQTSMAFRRTDFARALLSARDVVEGLERGARPPSTSPTLLFRACRRKTLGPSIRLFERIDLCRAPRPCKKLEGASPSFGWFSALASAYDVEAFEHIGCFSHRRLECFLA